MTSPQTSYELNPHQLDAALAALAKAQDSFSLSPRQKLLHRALGICTRITTVAFILSLLALGLFVGYAVFEPESPMAGIGCAVGGGALLVGILAGAVATVLLIFNIGTVLRVLRKGKLVRQLGLSDVSYSAWKIHHKRRFFSRIGGAAYRMIGAISTILGIVTIAGAVIAFFDEATAAETSVPIAFLAGGAFLLVGTTILTWQAVQRTQERLALVADANKLRAMLSSLESGAESGVVVPAAVLERVAVIEHAQIARERARAVLAGVSTAKRGYAVEISRPAAERKAALPPDLRLDVEELIEELAAGSQPPALHADHGDGTFSVQTPDKSAAVEYQVDDGNRRIHVVAVRSPAHLTTEPAEASHAT